MESQNNEFIRQPSNIRLRTVKLDKIYLKDYIEDDFKNHPIPESIRCHRNYSLFFISFQILFAFASLIIYLRQRSRVILIASIMSIALSIIGLIGTIRVNSAMMFTHSFFCVSVFGAFYVYLILEMIFLRQPTSTQPLSGEESLSDTAVKFLYSIPYLVVFIVGCHSIYLFNLVFDERKARQDEDRQLHEPLLVSGRQ